MKKLEISQMENLQGAWGKREWCLTSYMLAAGGAMFLTAGAGTALAVAAMAAGAMSC